MFMIECNGMFHTLVVINCPEMDGILENRGYCLLALRAFSKSIP